MEVKPLRCAKIKIKNDINNHRNVKTPGLAHHKKTTEQLVKNALEDNQENNESLQ